ncbi:MULTISPECIES: protease inhibitor I9 family protein [unclassified Streptomyces]|uniref:protease inhibitor I9 family protein n=1 Tax=unclassified Streptomyces TaxID=2593676 RepID=UPI00202F4381|nr:MULTISPECIES: protease inhibitor I9 family protein [unclassified Streptomyces]MCM1975196.1 protease inhibitor I9 family protein [Streptomyces sp. G1]MCX5124321.1 protease inhibitor I9 family protein [Streptomyces sp. NBC_00347]MCX5297569.1 protease inhibitor I9 family protein [Streptomyces sp. NBC_00193]
MRTRTSWTLPTTLAALALAASATLPAHAAPLSPTTGPAAPASRTAPAEWPTYIVTVHRGLDPAAVADAYGITPVHVYRHALNGFSARLSPDQVESLRSTAVVTSVEPDGPVAVSGPAV